MVQIKAEVPASTLRVAIVHEWIDFYDGSVQVFEALAQLVPHADLFALSMDSKVSLDIGGRPIRTTFLDSAKLSTRRGMTLPIMPIAWFGLGSGNYDLVLTSHHAFAHGNRLVADTGRHLAYVHTPARYIWSPEIDERGRGVALAPARAVLKRLDRKFTSGVDAYAGNSAAVADRIHRYWGRRADVIYPPVRVAYYAEHGIRKPTRDYVLGVGRWVPYKNLHLVVKAASLVGLPVKIAGRGPSKWRIEQAAEAASVPVEIIESPSDSELRDLYANAACLVFPTVEDFGMVPVEAQATGTPVVAVAEGGAVETVNAGVSGVLVGEISAEALADAIPQATRLYGDGPRDNVAKFSQQSFSESITEWVWTRGGVALRE